MANNKVELSTGEVLIDLTSDTVEASNLLAGETAHNRSGEPVTGTVNLNDYVLKSGDTMSGSLSVTNSEITVAGATSAHGVNVQGSGGLTVTLHLAASGNHGIYSSGYASSLTATATASGSWIINRTSDNYVTIPKWANTGSSDVPVYFDSTGKPIACGILKNVYHLHNVDSRSTDYTPNQYLSDSGARQSLSYEFKNRTTISASGSSTFGNLFTVVPWQDSSGGYPFQLYGSADGTLAYRSSNSNGTGWNSWEKIFKSKRIYGAENDIYYEGTKASYSMIHFIDNTSDTYGNGISIGGGGQTIIGGGESAGVMAAEAGTSGSEYMWIGNDGSVDIYTNLQNGWGSKQTFSFDTWGNLTIPGYLNGNIYDGNVYWGGSSKSGGYAPIDAGFLEIARGNRFAGIPGSAVTVEYTRNGGSSWGIYTNDNSIKTALFTTSTGFYIGAADSNNKATANGTNYQLRITINTGTGNVYSEINKIAINVSTNGSQYCKVQVRTALESTPTTFVERGTYSLSGWSGWNVINLGGNSFTTYGNTASSQYGRIQFIFSANGGNTNYIGLQVLAIQAFGGQGWVTPSTLAKTGCLYSYDSSLSASFPNSISAAGNITSSGHIEATTYVKANTQLDSTNGVYLPRDTSGKDFNSLSPSVNTYKIFEQYGGSNNPYGTQWAYVLSMRGSDSNFEEQFAINETNVSSSDTGPHVKYRRKYSGTWESWYEFLTTARTVTVGQGGTGATDAAGARSNIQVPRLYLDTYPTLMAGYDGTSNNWIKFGTANTSYGILPSQAGNPGSGHNYLGASTWYWKGLYVDALNDYNMHPSTGTGTRNTSNTSAGTASYIKYGRVCVVSISVTPNSNSAGSGKTLFTGLPKASLSQYFVLQCAATSNYKHLVCTIDSSGTIATSGDGHLNLEYRGQVIYVFG